MPEVFIKKDPYFNDSDKWKHQYLPAHQDVLFHEMPGNVTNNLAAHMPKIITLLRKEKLGEPSAEKSQVAVDILPPFSDFAVNTPDLFIELRLMWSEDREYKTARGQLEHELQQAVEDLFEQYEWHLPSIDYQVSFTFGRGLSAHSGKSSPPWESELLGTLRNPPIFG